MQKQISTISEDFRVHKCLHGALHIMNGMKLLVGIGSLIILILLTLEIIYFRRAIFVLAIPTGVIVCTVWAIIKQDSQFVWPIIGISFFHFFISLYAGLIFLFYFFFKPLYIIMILNWAFDTLHTGKTLSFYLSSAAIISGITICGAFNLWQLCVSLRYREYLKNFLNESSLSSLAPLDSASKLKRSSSDFGPTVLIVNQNSERIEAPPSSMDDSKSDESIENEKKR